MDEAEGEKKGVSWPDEEVRLKIAFFWSRKKREWAENEMQELNGRCGTSVARYTTDKNTSVDLPPPSFFACICLCLHFRLRHTHTLSPRGGPLPAAFARRPPPLRAAWKKCNLTYISDFQINFGVASGRGEDEKDEAYYAFHAAAPSVSLLKWKKCWATFSYGRKRNVAALYVEKEAKKWMRRIPGQMSVSHPKTRKSRKEKERNTETRVWRECLWLFLPNLKPHMQRKGVARSPVLFHPHFKAPPPPPQGIKSRCHRIGEDDGFVGIVGSCGRGGGTIKGIVFAGGKSGKYGKRTYVQSCTREGER